MSSQEENVLEVMGDCPSCKKGRVHRKDHLFDCNYFQSENDKCDFIIYKTYFSHTLSDDEVKQLLKKGKTSIITDFVSKSGNPFSAILKVEDGKIVPDFEPVYYDKPCPCCNGQLRKTRYSLICQNTDHCKFALNFMVAGYTLKESDISKIFNGKTTDFLSFEKADGTEFVSRLKLNKEKQIIEFTNEVGKCPKCKDGNIFLNAKAYGCSNYRNKQCSFTVWAEIRGKKIGLKEISQLIELGSFKANDFKGKAGDIFSGTISFDESYMCQFVKG